MRKAWSLYRSGVPTFSEALRQAWKVTKAVTAGTVTFWKVPAKKDADAEITTRRIAELSQFDYTPKGSGTGTSTIKVVDLDKLATTGQIAASIISFNAYQIL
jgi:hypothetical protein